MTTFVRREGVTSATIWAAVPLMIFYLHVASSINLQLTKIGSNGFKEAPFLQSTHNILLS